MNSLARIALIITCALVPSLASAEEVTLNKSDIEVLERINKMEEAANFGSTVLALAPLVSLGTSSNMVEFTFTFLNTDFADHATAIGSLQKIKACSISDVITIHMLDIEGGPKYDFFQALATPYSDACT